MMERGLVGPTNFIANMKYDLIAGLVVSPVDAKGLAMMGCEQSLESWQPSSPGLLKLRSLTRQIESLQNHKTSFLNQFESANQAAIIDRMVIN